jgi:hypothetical protein
MKVTTSDFGQHLNPIWKKRADYILGAHVPHMGPGLWEQLWATRSPTNGFEICCIPFFAHDLNLGDVVELDDDSMVTKVLRSSGRRTTRIWLIEVDIQSAEVRQLMRNLADCGALVEWYSSSFLAADAGTESVFNDTQLLLGNAEREGFLGYGARFE